MFDKVIKIIIEEKGNSKHRPKSRSYVHTPDSLTFHDFMKDRYRKYYKVKPYTVDDV